jgi:uncharacterized protein YcaQ
MDAITITNKQARSFLVRYHGLSGKFEFRGKEGIMAFIRRMGCIQFDPLNVVGTNPELVLQSRIENFDRRMLAELLYEDRKLIDYWDKQMSILPVEDWPYLSRLRAHYGSWCHSNTAVVDKVRAEIETRGALCSGDLDDNEKVDWAWGPTRLSRAALEGMYHAGQLVVHHKTHTRKYYDLTERHVPEELHAMPEPFESDSSYYEWYVLRRIGSVGLLWNRPSDAWLGIRGLKSLQRNEAFAKLAEEGRIAQVQVEGTQHPLYIRAQDLEMLRQSLSEDDNEEERASVLAPLDNLLWDRQLIKELFGFEYRWEVYKPAAERDYGYYVLPVVYGDRILARFDPLKQRKNSPFVIQQWWWEESIAPTEPMKLAIRKSLERFAANLGTHYQANEDHDL